MLSLKFSEFSIDAVPSLLLAVTNYDHKHDGVQDEQSRDDEDRQENVWIEESSSFDQRA